jgi:hypothetical protein
MSWRPAGRVGVTGHWIGDHERQLRAEDYKIAATGTRQGPPGARGRQGEAACRLAELEGENADRISAAEALGQLAEGRNKHPPNWRRRRQAGRSQLHGHRCGCC